METRSLLPVVPIRQTKRHSIGAWKACQTARLSDLTASTARITWDGGINGYAQIELAGRIGAIRALISAYERDKLRLNGKMAVRFALALEVSTDELLGLAGTKAARGEKPSRKILRRMEQSEKLPAAQQAILLKTIGTVIKAASK